MTLKKIAAGIILGAGFFILAGCGTKQATNKGADDNQIKTPSSDAYPQNMPSATGKVDDTVNSILKGAASEDEQAVKDEKDAKAAADEGQDLNNLNNAYDQNAIQ